MSENQVLWLWFTYMFVCLIVMFTGVVRGWNSIVVNIAAGMVFVPVAILIIVGYVIMCCEVF